MACIFRCACTGAFCPDNFLALEIVDIQPMTRPGASQVFSVETLENYIARSGPFGNGALENGDYVASNLRTRDNVSGMQCNGSGYSMDLDPTFDTQRTLLRIHPDGNNPGTLGCVGIDCDDADRFREDVESYLDDSGRIDLHVYGC